LIGKGASGAVYKGIINIPSKPNTVVAIKTFTIDHISFSETDYKREIAIASILSHRNIVTCYGGGKLDSGLFIAMEFCEQGSLRDLLLREENLSPNKTLKIALKVSRGLEYIHSMKLIHRDVKSMNILINSEGNIKITDFGTSAIERENKLMTGNLGTLGWMAPELFLGRTYSEKIDVYSFAIVLWELLSHGLPFDQIEVWRIPLMITGGERPIIPKTNCPEDFIRLIRICWVHHPEQRPSFINIMKYLKQIREQIKKKKKKV